MLHYWGNDSHKDGDRQIGVDRYSACKSRTWTDGCFLLPKHSDDELGMDRGALKFATATSSAGRCMQQFSGGDVDRFCSGVAWLPAGHDYTATMEQDGAAQGENSWHERR